MPERAPLCLARGHYPAIRTKPTLTYGLGLLPGYGNPERPCTYDIDAARTKLTRIVEIGTAMQNSEYAPGALSPDVAAVRGYVEASGQRLVYIADRVLVNCVPTPDPSPSPGRCYPTTCPPNPQGTRPNIPLQIWTEKLQGYFDALPQLRNTLARWPAPLACPDTACRGWPP